MRQRRGRGDTRRCACGWRKQRLGGCRRRHCFGLGHNLRACSAVVRSIAGHSGADAGRTLPWTVRRRGGARKRRSPQHCQCLWSRTCRRCNGGPRWHAIHDLVNLAAAWRRGWCSDVALCSRHDRSPAALISPLLRRLRWLRLPPPASCRLTMVQRLHPSRPHPGCTSAVNRTSCSMALA